jgi:hypothetical protein
VCAADGFVCAGAVVGLLVHFDGDVYTGGDAAGGGGGGVGVACVRKGLVTSAGWVGRCKGGGRDVQRMSLLVTSVMGLLLVGSRAHVPS